MTRRALFAWFSSITAGLVLAGTMVLPVSAATSSIGGTGDGLKVSPVTTSLNINPGQTQTVTMYVQNVTGGAMTVQALANDFTASGDESGAPALLLNNQYAPTHSLKRFITPLDNIVLQPGEQKSVVVTISIPSSASAGGYFGAVRFLPVSTVKGGTVTLSASVGSLILVKVPGNYKESMSLLSFETLNGQAGTPRTIFTTNKNITVSMRFQNNGDVQEQPFGKVLLQSGKNTVATYEVNNTTPRGNVLPDSIRKFTITLDKVGMFGKYTVVGNFGYGSSGQLLSGQTTFYVIPATLLMVVAGIVIVLLLAVFVLPKMIKGYNRRVVEKSRRR